MQKLHFHSIFSLHKLVSPEEQVPLRFYGGLTVCLFAGLSLFPAIILFWNDPRPYMLCVSFIAFGITVLGAACVYLRIAYKLIMHLVLSGLIAISLFVISFGGVIGNGSVVWMTLLPPMCILALGLKRGTILFGLAYLALVVMFIPPVVDLLPFKYPVQSRIWLLLVMLAAWIFSWLSEFARYQVQQQLVEVVTHLEHYAFSDPLTHLGNRREFENSFIRENALLLRQNRPFSIMMFDLDHFKAVNDRYGHNAGDAVLVQTARILQENLRASDQLSRWGGEEFTALLPDTGLVEATEIAERIRIAVQNTPCVYENKSIAYTISAGVYLCAEDLPLEKHIEFVDGLLYMAKNNGRNQVQAGTVSGPQAQS